MKQTLGNIVNKIYSHWDRKKKLSQIEVSCLEAVAAYTFFGGTDVEETGHRGAGSQWGSFPLNLSKGWGQLDGLDRVEGLERFLAWVWRDSLDRHGQQLIPFDDLESQLGVSWRHSTFKRSLSYIQVNSSSQAIQRATNYSKLEKKTFQNTWVVNLMP